MIETVKFLYFWLNYSVKNNQLQRTLIALKNIDHLFCMASELLESDELHLFSLSDGTRITMNT